MREEVAHVTRGHIIKGIPGKHGHFPTSNVV